MVKPELERAAKFIHGRHSTWKLTQGSRNGHVGAQDQGLGDWTARLLLTSRGEPAQNAANIGAILEHHPAWNHLFWFDVVRQRPMVGDAPLTDKLVTDIARWLGDDMRMSCSNLALVQRCVVAQCQATPRDLLQEWLDGLPDWDTTTRLTTWLPQCAGTESGPYGAYVSAIVPVSMVARAFDPGCIHRHVVILEGAEESRKSTLGIGQK